MLRIDLFLLKVICFENTEAEFRVLHRHWRLGIGWSLQQVLHFIVTSIHLLLHLFVHCLVHWCSWMHLLYYGFWGLNRQVLQLDHHLILSHASLTLTDTSHSLRWSNWTRILLQNHSFWTCRWFFRLSTQTRSCLNLSKYRTWLKTIFLQAAHFFVVFAIDVEWLRLHVFWVLPIWWLSLSTFTIRLKLLTFVLIIMERWTWFVEYCYVGFPFALVWWLGICNFCSSGFAVAEPYWFKMVFGWWLSFHWFHELLLFWRRFLVTIPIFTIMLTLTYSRFNSR